MRFGKSLGIVLTVALTLVWVGSVFAEISYLDRGNSPPISLYAGTVQGLVWLPLSEMSWNRREWHFAASSPQLVWKPTLVRWPLFDMTLVHFVFPLWIPILILAVLTMALSFIGRRIPPGHCRQCRYDLTGNVSGRCPECGGAV